MTKIIKVLLLGHGTVGRGFRNLILHEKEKIAQAIEQMTGESYTIEIVGTVVKNPEKHEIPQNEMHTSFDIVENGDYDILVELVGGNDEAEQAIQTAFARGKDVVTANKMAVFLGQGKYEEQAKNQGCYFCYEAAVAAAIPVLRSIDSLSWKEGLLLEGIVNGSTNYIFTRVDEGLTFDEAMKEAFEKGFLEMDPTSDTEGFDAMYKLGILVYRVTGSYPKEEEILRKGITTVGDALLQEAKNRGNKYKLIAKADFKNHIYSVQPEEIGPDHFLYSIDGAMNGIAYQHPYAGQLGFFGPGAGGNETASAVLGDVLSIIYQRIGEKKW